MPDNLSISLQNFVDWVNEHLTGDEKGEAQIFLDRLFAAFGLGGVKEVGGSLEFRVKRSGKRGVKTGFADYVWKPIVLIEMKRRGEKLRKHQPQAFNYWVHLAPNRPRWVILCNFDEFWIYDFDTQIDEPVDRLTLGDLPRRYNPLAFLRPSSPEPTFRHNLEEVTREAADLLSDLFNGLVERDVERPVAQRFLLQCLVALFAEDIGLLPTDFFAQLLSDCTSPSKSYDLLGGLFHEMNRKGKTPGGRYKGVEYFNGGLFAEPISLELRRNEILKLSQAAKYRWELVRPEIFGTIFEHSMGKALRHAQGAYFTSATDIMRIVGPTIVDPWSEAIENATTQKELNKLRQRLSQLRVLDPACGSGNFLYIAYRQMKRLEARMMERTKELSRKTDTGQLELGFVTAAQFFGIDVNPFAVELAKVTMMIARKLAIDELHLPENALPLHNLEKNFYVHDALLDGRGKRQWPQADVIIGNPPFLGAKRLLAERRAPYLERLRGTYDDISAMVDYCVYWFGKAHEHLPFCSKSDPFSGRAGLVATQSIRFGESCAHGPSAIERHGGVIVEALDNHPWSGAANVNVSIINWMKPASGDNTVVPRYKRLWTHANGDLAFSERDMIPPDLSSTTDIRSAKVLSCNRLPKACFQGVTTGTTKFLIRSPELKNAPSRCIPVLRPFLGADEMVSGKGVYRWAIDFTGMSLFQAKRHKWAWGVLQERGVLRLMETRVQQARQKGKVSDIRAREAQLEQWWRFWRVREDMTTATRKLARCLASPRHGRHHILMFVDPEILLGDALQVFAFEDLYSFGILQSSVHEAWWKKSSRLKNEKDVRYSEKKVFATFPWPQNPSAKVVKQIGDAARELQAQRRRAQRELGTDGLRAVYSALSIPGKSQLKEAHTSLDRIVVKAYGFRARGDLLEQLLALNREVSRRIEAEDPVQAPGIPDGFSAPRSLVGSERLVPPRHPSAD